MKWDKITKTTKRSSTIMELKNYVIKDGAYCGDTIIGLHLKDPGYLYWISNANIGEFSEMAKEYLDWVDGQ